MQRWRPAHGTIVGKRPREVDCNDAESHHGVSDCSTVQVIALQGAREMAQRDQAVPVAQKADGYILVTLGHGREAADESNLDVVANDLIIEILLEHDSKAPAHGGISLLGQFELVAIEGILQLPPIGFHLEDFADSVEAQNGEVVDHRKAPTVANAFQAAGLGFVAHDVWIELHGLGDDRLNARLGVDRPPALPRRHASCFEHLYTCDDASNAVSARRLNDAMNAVMLTEPRWLRLQNIVHVTSPFCCDDADGLRKILPDKDA